MGMKLNKIIKCSLPDPYLLSCARELVKMQYPNLSYTSIMNEKQGMATQLELELVECASSMVNFTKGTNTRCPYCNAKLNPAEVSSGANNSSSVINSLWIAHLL